MMDFRPLRSLPTDPPDALIVPVFSDGTAPGHLDEEQRRLAEWLAGETGTKKLYETMIHLDSAGEGRASRVVAVNAGDRDEYSVERARLVASAAVRALWRTTVDRVAIVVAADGIGAGRAVQATVEGTIYSLWRPEVHRTSEQERRLPPVASVDLIVDGAPAEDPGDGAGGGTGDLGAAVARGQAVGEAVNLARRLANEPANLMTPTLLAEEAQRLASENAIECEVLDEDRCRELGMNSYLSVAQGSHQPPRLIVLRYRGRDGDGYDLAIVGKGITFDSGGISLKPGDDMHKMKYDMTGAASVIAVLGALGRLRPGINVLGVAPCTENLPGGGATKPGDVFTSMSGKTVEVINTDAEGRLVLIDGVTYAEREGARRVVDVATLTGAISVALGRHFTGLFGRPASFVEQVRAAGEAAGDRLWAMPLTDEYRDEVKSEIADLRNSAGREGSAIKGAAFIEAGVSDDVEWAHLDIASTAWFDQDRPFAPKGPQGPAVRALIELADRLQDT